MGSFRKDSEEHWCMIDERYIAACKREVNLNLELGRDGFTDRLSAKGLGHVAMDISDLIM